MMPPSLPETKTAHGGVLTRNRSPGLHHDALACALLQLQFLAWNGSNAWRNEIRG